MYYIQIAAGSLQTCEEIGITSARLTHIANGIDTFDFASDSALTAAGIAFGTAIKLYDVATCVFIGEVTDIPSDKEVAAPGQKRYKAKNFLNQLERIQYTQDISAYNATAAEVQTFVDPRVVLGVAYPAARITNTAQIAAVIDFAIAVKSVPLTRGSFPVGFMCPVDQKENIFCWDAIISQLRWIPDHVLRCDYSTGSTVVNLSVPNMFYDAYVEGDLSGVRVTPRYDLQMVGLNVFFRKVSTVDGVAIESRSFQSAGDNTNPFATNLYVDLDGGSVEFARQAITVSDYPAFTTPASEALEAWIEAKVPWLADIEGYVITAVARSGAHAYTKELLKGVILKWMPVLHEEETLTFTIEYDIKDADGNYIERATTKIPVQVTSCNGTTKTYSKIMTSDSGEVEPAGLAAGIYASWSRLHWDGNLSSYLPKVRELQIGRGLNIINGTAAMSGMGAYIQSIEIDLQTRSTNIQFGTCKRLEADSYTALYRAIRYRRFSTRLLADEDNEDAEEKDDTSVVATPKGTLVQSPGVNRKQIGTSSTDSRKTSLSSEDLASGEEAKLRAVAVPGGSVKVLASGTMDVFKWDATAPAGYEWETVNIVLDNKIVTREILVKTSTKTDVATWSSADARLLLQVKGGTGGDAGKLRVDKGYLKT